MHPAHASVARAIASHVLEVRGVSTRGEMRGLQERLLGSLLEAERRFAAASRLTKRRSGDPIELLFWRRACIQLRAIGDGLAWKFLAFDRARIVLLGRNQRPGLIVGKEGSIDEWAACEEHWNAGRPALLTALTNQITVCDLLAADGDTLLANEVKRRSTAKMPRSQRQRMAVLDRALRDLVIETDGHATRFVRSELPLASHWSSAQAAIDEATEFGFSTWVPEPGVGVLFTAVAGAGPEATRDTLTKRLADVQQSAAERIGPVTHRIVVDSYSYPYRPNHAVPIPLLPISPASVTQMLAGELLFKVEVSVDRIVAMLNARGFDVSILLDTANDTVSGRTPILAWRRRGARGVVHGAAVEQLAIELLVLDRWADAFDAASAVSSPGESGFYLCLADEESVWA